TGWTVGVGYEYALGYGWSIKGEYLYVKFDDYTTFTQPPFGAANIAPRNVNLNDNIFRAGMNYKIGGWGQSPGKTFRHAATPGLRPGFLRCARSTSAVSGAASSASDYPLARSSRPRSRSQLRFFSVSRLSCSFLPRASASSSLARPLSLK